MAQVRLNILLSRLELPDYLHSARKGRSYRTNAMAHMGKGPAFRIDIRKFYQNARDAYVYRFFRYSLECSPDVAHCLTELTCYQRFLPTGSALSPIISFLAYRPMFDELYALAQSVNVTMTVYVDDIVMSGAEADGKMIPKCKRILKNYELQGHKILKFSNGETRVITGVAVGPEGIGIPNKRRRKIRALREELQRANDPLERLRYKNALLGQLREGAPLDSSLSDLAAMVKQIPVKASAQTETTSYRKLTDSRDAESDTPPW
ncbi:MAG: reverse transcriptase family protein [Nevskia sp.]|nr:reverse transcriptase family protein [Nevskia sp.]